MNDDVTCPLCITKIPQDKQCSVGGDWQRTECDRCGTFQVTDSVVEEVTPQLQKSPLKAAAMSYAVRRMTQHGVPKLRSYDLLPILENVRLPKPAEQADNLVLWLGDQIQVAGDYIPCRMGPLQAIIGTASADGVTFIVDGLINQGLVTKLGHDGSASQTSVRKLTNFELTLTFEGFARLEELLQNVVDSKRAFMAMQFGDAQLDALFAKHFVPAVAATGFDLRRVIDGQPAGLIDDRLRVDLRASRFVLADLTHRNRGAYWEAGFAEGLGRPVIYTCRKNVFENPETAPHFDTNHYVTVIWDPDDIETAMKKLRDTIRATLPGEAKLED